MKKYITYLIILCSCASIQSLDGGDKDETPPKIISQIPDSASLNIETTKIEIVLDEYIKLQNPSNLLLISPNQKTPPTVTYKGKKVFIQLNDSLLQNTTYSIEINGSIVDYNESNQLNAKLIFSTGSYIDSLKYTGYITNLENNTACEECYVMLYTIPQDSNVLLTKPDYLAKTNKAGRYRFTNLPKAQFQLIAIQDDNKNLKIERDELTSLYQTITTDTSIQKPDTLNIFTYLPYKKNKPALVKPQKQGIVQIAFSETLLDSVRISINTTPLSYQLNNTRDTLTAFYKPQKDSNTLQLVLLTDTTEYTLNNPSIPIKFSINSVSQETVSLTTNCHIDSINPSLFQLTTESTTSSPDSIYFTGNLITLTHRIQYDSSYILLIDSGALTSITNITNKQDSIQLPLLNSSNPKLTLKLTSTDTIPKLVQILQKNKILYQTSTESDTTLSITQLNPGSYVVKIITDLNTNGIWDTGNPIKQLSPEPIQFSEQFELRNNWDKELIINIL